MPEPSGAYELQLTPYEAANLMHLVRAIYRVQPDHPVPADTPVSRFNTGDWIGQLHWKLQAEVGDEYPVPPNTVCVPLIASDPERRAAVTVGRALMEQRDEARAALAEVLNLFIEKGHPGRPCRRTGWVYEESVARWRAILADTGPTPSEPQRPVEEPS